MRRLAWLLAALMMLALPLAGTAQAQTGGISGVVTDPTGAVVPGVTVNVTRQGATVRSVVSDATGHFDVSNLPPGTYDLSFELAGFRTQTSTAVVAAGAPVSLDVKLELGGQSEQVQVTGTLIPRPMIEAASPVTTLDATEITARGNARIEDILFVMPQVYSTNFGSSGQANGASGTASADLRYLGAGRTMVLIDGRRMPSGDALDKDFAAPDLNFIPTFLIKSVDVLTGGASSVYGADAVSGVVNFILDRDFVGAKGGVQFGGYQHNNRNDLAKQINAAKGFTVPTGSVMNRAPSSFNVALGANFDQRKGHATVYLDYRDTPAITKDQRDYVNCSVSTLGASGPACAGSSTWQGGRFIATGKPGTSAAGTRADYVLDATTGAFRARQATDLFNFAPYNFMQRPDTRWTGGGFMNYVWNSHAEAYSDVMFMDDYTDAQIAPSGDFANTTKVNCDNPMLSAQQRQVLCTDMGYGPTDVANIIVQRRNVEGGGRISQIRHTDLRFSFGMRGDINDTWRYDVYGLQGEVHSPQTYANDLNVDRIQDALIVDGAPGDPSTWHCRAATTGCAPWNVFSKGGVTQAALDFLQLPLVLDSGTRSRGVDATVTGNLGNAGMKLGSASDGIRVAFGGGYRQESLFVHPDLSYQLALGAGQGGPTLPVDGDYNVKEFFTEAQVPIVQNAHGARDLSVELGYRYSDYSTTGGAPTYKTGISWAPTGDLRFRAGYNRATRSPNVQELFVPQGLSLGGSEDLCAGTKPTATREQCVRLGVPTSAYGTILDNPAGQYNTLEGGNPDLKQEKGDTYTAGVVLTPARMPRFTATLDFYDIKLDSTIDNLNADDIMNQCAATGDATLCGLIHRDSLGTLWLLTSGYTVTTYQNIGKKESMGLDVTANYGWPLSDHGTLSVALAGTYMMHERTNTGLFAYDCLGFYGNQCGIPTPKWRHLTRFSWSAPFNATISATWRMVGSVKNDDLSSNAALGDPSNVETLKLNLADKFKSFHYLDLSATYRLPNDYRIIAGVNNIFDKEPPLGSGSTDNDYGPGFYGTYDFLGRYLFAGIQFTFQ